MFKGQNDCNYGRKLYNQLKICEDVTLKRKGSSGCGRGKRASAAEKSIIEDTQDIDGHNDRGMDVLD